MKTFKPTKVKFNPMPIKEEETILHYLSGFYTGPWKNWFDKKFIEFTVINRNYTEMVQMVRLLWGYTYFKAHWEYEKIENECVEAVRLAYPYIHRGG